jgi:hypothetical protein
MLLTTEGVVMPRQVFICYSHADREWLGRLKITMAPFEDIGEIAVLDDTQIPPGGLWAETIDRYLGSADVAVVLTSAALLASTFVRDVELPAVIEAAKSGRLTLVWVSLSASLWEATELAQFQAAIDPRRPLDMMATGEANAALVKIAEVVAASHALTEIGRSLNIVDQIAEATSEVAYAPRVQARHRGDKVVFESRDASAPLEEITADDLVTLATAERMLIGALESSMESSFERWSALRARSNRLTTRERAEYEEAGQQMCAELSNILDFIQVGLGKTLDDHYHAVRFACGRLVTLPTPQPLI